MPVLLQHDEAMVPHIQNFFSAFGQVSGGKKSFDSSADNMEPAYGQSRMPPRPTWGYSSFGAPPGATMSGVSSGNPTPPPQENGGHYAKNGGSVPPPPLPGAASAPVGQGQSRFWFANDKASPPPGPGVANVCSSQTSTM